MKMAQGAVSASVRKRSSLSRSASAAVFRSRAVATWRDTKVRSSRSSSVNRAFSE